MKPPKKYPLLSGSKFDLRTGTWANPRNGMGIEYDTLPDDLSSGMATFNLVGSLGRGERGAVVSDGITYTPSEKREGFHTWPDPQRRQVSIRNALLFCELVDSPQQGNFRYDKVTDLPDIDGLVRSQVKVSYPSIARTFTGMSFDLWNMRNKMEPGRWTLFTGPRENLIPIDERSNELAFRMMLQDCLIVPAGDVPFDDIVSFRNRNQDVLINLRHHIDKLCVKIAQSGYNSLEMQVEAEIFERALIAYNKEASKANWRKVISSMEVEMSWSDLIKKSHEYLIATGVVGLLNHSLAKTALAFAGLAAASIGIKSIRSLKKEERNFPYHYIVKADKELNV